MLALVKDQWPKQGKGCISVLWEGDGSEDLAHCFDGRERPTGSYVLLSAVNKARTSCKCGKLQ